MERQCFREVTRGETQKGEARDESSLMQAPGKDRLGSETGDETGDGRTAEPGVAGGDSGAGGSRVDAQARLASRAQHHGRTPLRFILEERLASDLVAELRSACRTALILGNALVGTVGNTSPVLGMAYGIG